jgi:hypothetical protein
MLQKNLNFYAKFWKINCTLAEKALQVIVKYAKIKAAVD